jgi:hypothetical protein
MKRFCTSLVGPSVAVVAVAMVAIAAFGCQITPASAAPPTVTPSPGYDARLQESHAPAQTYYEPAVRMPAPVHRRHVKRVHDGAH